MTEANAAKHIPLINSKVSLVTNCNARYNGTVSEIDREKNTITLENVRIADGAESYEFIVFLLSGIKEIEAINFNTDNGVHNPDPAVVKGVVKTVGRRSNNNNNNNQFRNNQQHQQQYRNGQRGNGYNYQNGNNNNRRNGGGYNNNNGQRGQNNQETVVILDPVSQKRIEINVKGNQPLQQVLRQVEPLLHSNNRGMQGNRQNMGRQSMQQNRRSREEWRRNEKQQALKETEKLIDATQTLNKIRKNQMEDGEEQKKVKEAWFTKEETTDNAEPSYKSQDFYDKISRPTKQEESDQRLQNSNTQAQINNATFGRNQQQQNQQSQPQRRQQRPQYNNFNRGYRSGYYNRYNNNNNNRRQPESYREGDQFFDMLEKLKPTPTEA